MGLDFIKLREELPFGAQADVARKFNRTPQYVNQVLAGRFYNEDIIVSLIGLRNEYQAKLKKIQREVNK